MSLDIVDAKPTTRLGRIRAFVGRGAVQTTLIVVALFWMIPGIGLLVTSFPIPLVFIESDVGFGGGVALTDIDFRQQRRREFAGIFLTVTSKGQQSYQMAWRRWLHHMDLPQGGVLQEERSFVRARGGYSKTLTRRFFGIGPDTREEDESRR